MKKDFDCVEMKRQGTEHVRRLTAGMTPEQKLAFWEVRSRRLGEEMASARAKAAEEARGVSKPESTPTPESPAAKKDFDCVEMKRRGAEHVRRLTTGMTKEELLAFWAERSQRLRDEIESVKRRQDPKAQRRSA